MLHLIFIAHSTPQTHVILQLLRHFNFPSFNLRNYYYILETQKTVPMIQISLISITFGNAVIFYI